MKCCWYNLLSWFGKCDKYSFRVVVSGARKIALVCTRILFGEIGSTVKALRLFSLCAKSARSLVHVAFMVVAAARLVRLDTYNHEVVGSNPSMVAFRFHFSYTALHFLHV